MVIIYTCFLFKTLKIRLGVLALKKPIGSSTERHFVNKKKGGENHMLKHFVLIHNYSIKIEKASIKTKNRTQFFFTHRTVMFIKGEILINTPAKLKKTYENEIA